MMHKGRDISPFREALVYVMLIGILSVQLANLIITDHARDSIHYHDSESNDLMVNAGQFLKDWYLLKEPTEGDSNIVLRQEDGTVSEPLDCKLILVAKEERLTYEHR